MQKRADITILETMGTHKKGNRSRNATEGDECIRLLQSTIDMDFICPHPQICVHVPLAIAVAQSSNLPL